MNAKQRLFVAEYLVDFKARDAAVRAGYSKKNPHMTAHRLLSNPKIAAAIDEEVKKLERRVELRQDDVVNELKKVAFDQAADTLGSPLKYSNKLKALELLGRYLGMFTEKIALTKIDQATVDEIEGLVNDAARGH